MLILQGYNKTIGIIKGEDYQTIIIEGTKYYNDLDGKYQKIEKTDIGAFLGTVRSDQEDVRFPVWRVRNDKYQNYLYVFLEGQVVIFVRENIVNNFK